MDRIPFMHVNFFGMQEERVAIYYSFRHTTKASERLQSQMPRPVSEERKFSGMILALMRIYRSAYHGH